MTRVIHEVQVLSLVESKAFIKVIINITGRVMPVSNRIRIESSLTNHTYETYWIVNYNPVKISESPNLDRSIDKLNFTRSVLPELTLPLLEFI